MDLFLQIKDHLIHKKEIMIFFSLIHCYGIIIPLHVQMCLLVNFESVFQMSDVAHEPPVLFPSMLHIIIALCKCGY